MKPAERAAQAKAKAPHERTPRERAAVRRDERARPLKQPTPDGDTNSARTP